MTQTIMYIEDGVDAFKSLLEMGESRIAGQEQVPPGQLIAGEYALTYKLEHQGEGRYYPILAISRMDKKDFLPSELHLPLADLIMRHLGDPIDVQKHTLGLRGPTIYLIYKESRLDANGRHDRAKAAERRMEDADGVPAIR